MVEDPKTGNSKNVLIATLGEHTEVIQEVVYKLAENGIHLDKVIVLYTKNLDDQKNYLIYFLCNKMNYTYYNQTTYKKTDVTPKFNTLNSKSVDMPDEYIFVDIGVDDIDASTEEKVENTIYYYVLKESISEDTGVYVSIAGGRKTESAIGYAAGLFFGALDILHVLPVTGVEEKEISALIRPDDQGFGSEIKKYDLIQMQKIEISELFKIAFKKRFLTDIREIEPKDSSRMFKIKGENEYYHPRNLLNMLSMEASNIIKTGLRSFINLGKALDDFGLIMTTEAEIRLYKAFVGFIQNDILLPNDLGVNWKVRWLWGLNVYPEFVNHDIEHSGEVLKKASQIIKEFGIDLQPKEKLILALGAMFHDIGMTGYEDKFHWTEVRKIHGILSAIKIKDQEGQGKIFKEDETFTSEIWKAVRTICAFHDGEKFIEEAFFGTNNTEECQLIKNADCFVERININGTEGFKIKDLDNNGEILRLNFLTSLLRLADACDMGKKMLMGNTVRELQVKWNEAGKDKAISLAKALLNCVDKIEIRNYINDRLNDLMTMDIQEKGREGMDRTQKIIDYTKKNLCYKELEEVLDRIYYFFKQSPDHYDFHKGIEDVIIKRENGANKIIIKISTNISSNEVSNVQKESKKRLDKEIEILKRFLDNNFNISVDFDNIQES